MASERTEVDIENELMVLIHRVGKGRTLDAADGDLLIRARAVIHMLRAKVKELEQAKGE